MDSTTSSAVRRAGRLLSGLGVIVATVAATVVLTPNPLADVFVAAWMVGSVLFALLGAAAAWTTRRALLWLAALLYLGVTLAGAMTVGYLLAPAALLLLAAAVALHLASPREGRRESIVADPPTATEAVANTVVGTAVLATGSVLVYVVAVERELFGSCARETVDCVVATTHWDAVGLALLGLGGVCCGGWLLWRQVYVVRVLSSHVGRDRL